MAETKQPVWKVVGTVGDINPIDYDGGCVFEDTTGVYPPELLWIESDDGGVNPEPGPWTVYRFVLDPPRFKTLTEKGKQTKFPLAPLPANERGDTWYWYNEWFIENIKGVADFAGRSVCNMLRSLMSKNPMVRAHAYLDLCSYHGFHEFDSDPLKFTSEDEIRAFYDKKRGTEAL